MIWVFGAVFMVVLALAAWAGTGRLGEMPEPVDDRPRAFIPDLPFGEKFVKQLRLPTVSVGYERTQVDRFVAEAERQPPPGPPRLLRAISTVPSGRGRGVGYSSPVQSEYP